MDVTTWPVFPLIPYSALHASISLHATWLPESLLQFAVHLEILILSNRYVSRQVVDGVLFSETNVKVPYQRLMAAKY